MNPKVYSYTGGKCVKDADMPPDPLRGDLCVHRVAGESVYSVLPMTEYGRAFVVRNHSAGTIDGDCLMVPARGFVSFFDQLVDEGLRVA